MVSVNFGSATDNGRVRDHNEDSLWVSPTLFVVADGMGGHAAGEVASDLAVTELASLAAQNPLQVDEVAAAVVRANDRILRAAAERGERHGMGTTLTGLGLVATPEGEAWVVFNVGDSRGYCFDRGVLQQLTVDHSEVAELIAAGHLHESQARSYPRRNVVTRSLGSAPPPRPDVWLLPVNPGERFLVCSDGLTNELDDPELSRILGEVRDPQAAADELVRLAVLAGGHDNVSVIVVDVLG